MPNRTIEIKFEKYSSDKQNVVIYYMITIYSLLLYLTLILLSCQMS
jgi:hypothetical protein